MPITTVVSTHSLARHLFAFGAALSLLLAVALFALWLVCAALFARRHPASWRGPCDALGF